MGYRRSGGESSNGNKKVLVILPDGEQKSKKDTTVDLLRSELQILRMHMAKLVDAGRNRTATDKDKKGKQCRYREAPSARSLVRDEESIT
ncbi:hypothetical protein C5167_025111 [Papaver somniferum]|uniref:Uncharacterized protein n=1 Tax=Papaver somniferum TaxID=3469 RepID=A0A4Y7JRI9_PAPSO|nr:hypothetical protein C5167_025111 [Papaver somniferum]